MLWLLTRGVEQRTCEVQLAADGPGYELIVAEHGRRQVERFAKLAALLAREHELLEAWRAQGWRIDMGAAPLGVRRAER